MHWQWQQLLKRLLLQLLSLMLWQWQQLHLRLQSTCFGCCGGYGECFGVS